MGKIEKGKWLVNYIAASDINPGELLYEIEQLTRPELYQFIQAIKELVNKKADGKDV